MVLDALNAEKNADKTTEEIAKCMMQFVQNAVQQLKSHSDRLRAEKFFVKNVLQKMLNNKERAYV